MRPKLAILTVILAFTLLVSWNLAPVSAVSLGDAVKLFGIAFVVKQFGGQINKFINTLLAQHGVAWEGTTKVVPIISIGRGTYVGAAQIAGPPELVDRVKAVAQGEIAIGGNLKGNALIPIGSTNVKKGISRVEGVGLSALIDFKI